MQDRSGPTEEKTFTKVFLHLNMLTCRDFFWKEIQSFRVFHSFSRQSKYKLFQPNVVLDFKDSDLQGNSRCFQIPGLECLSSVPPGRALNIQIFCQNTIFSQEKMTWSLNSGCGNWVHTGEQVKKKSGWVLSCKSKATGKCVSFRGLLRDLSQLYASSQGLCEL